MQTFGKNENKEVNTAATEKDDKGNFITQEEYNKLYGSNKRLETQMLKKDADIQALTVSVQALTGKLDSVSAQLTQKQESDIKTSILEASGVADVDKVGELLDGYLKNNSQTLANTHTVQPGQNNMAQNNQPSNMAQVALYNFQMKNNNWFNVDSELTQFANAQILMLSNDPAKQAETANGNYVNFFSELQTRCDKYKNSLSANTSAVGMPNSGPSSIPANSASDQEIDVLVTKIRALKPEYAALPKEQVTAYVKANINTLK